MVCHHLIEEGQCGEREKIEPIRQFIADTNGDKQKRDNRNLIALMLLSRDDEYCVIKIGKPITSESERPDNLLFS